MKKNNMKKMCVGLLSTLMLIALSCMPAFAMEGTMSSQPVVEFNPLPWLLVIGTAALTIFELVGHNRKA